MHSDDVGEAGMAKRFTVKLSFAQISARPSFAMPVSRTLTPCHPICTRETSRGNKS